MFMRQCDPGDDDQVPTVCTACKRHQNNGELRATQLLNGLFTRVGDPTGIKG